MKFSIIALVILAFFGHCAHAAEPCYRPGSLQVPCDRAILDPYFKLRRYHIASRNLKPWEPRPTPRTNVPPVEPLQFERGVKVRK